MWNSCRTCMSFWVIVVLTVLAKFSVHGFNYFQRQDSSNYNVYTEELIQDSRPVKSHGSWTSYSPWSSCSRSCGPGIQQRNRTCLHRISHDILPNEDCIGEPKETKVCKLQDCPTGVYSNFRQQECDQISTSEKIWKPLYYPEDPALNPCWLSCYSNQATEWKIINHEVPDGTHCVTKTGPGVCIDSECKMYGCDGLVGSTKVKDVCGVCDGDGSSCNVVTSTKIVNHLQVGYNEALEIPSGATNIRVLELYGGKNYLALREQDGTYVINGNYRIENSRIFVVSGSLCSYQRRETLEHDAGVSHREMFSCKGPFNDTITVMVLTRDRSPSYLAYEYTLPLEPVLVSPLSSSTTEQSTTIPTTASQTTMSSATVSPAKTSTTVFPSTTSPTSKSGTTVSTTPTVSTTLSSKTLLDGLHSNTTPAVVSSRTASTTVASKPVASSEVFPAAVSLEDFLSVSSTKKPSTKDFTSPSLDIVRSTTSKHQENFEMHDDESEQVHSPFPFNLQTRVTTVSKKLETDSGIVPVNTGVMEGTDNVDMDPSDISHHALVPTDEGPSPQSNTPGIIKAMSDQTETSNLKPDKVTSTKKLSHDGILDPTQIPISSKLGSSLLEDGGVFTAFTEGPRTEQSAGVFDPEMNFQGTTRTPPSSKDRLATAPSRQKSPSTEYQTRDPEYPSYSFGSHLELAYYSNNYFEWSLEDFAYDNRQTAEPSIPDFAFDVTTPPLVYRNGDAQSTPETLGQSFKTDSVHSVTSVVTLESHSSLEMAESDGKGKSDHMDHVVEDLGRTSPAPLVDDTTGEADGMVEGEVTAKSVPSQLLPRVVPELKFEEPRQREIVPVTLGLLFAELVDPRLSNITLDNKISSKAGNYSHGRLNPNAVEGNQIPDFQRPVSNPRSPSETVPPVRRTTESQSTKVRGASTTTMSPTTEKEMSTNMAKSASTTSDQMRTLLAKKGQTTLITTDSPTTFNNTEKASIKSTSKTIPETTTVKTTTTTLATTTKEIPRTEVTTKAFTTTTPVAMTTTPTTTTTATTTTAATTTTVATTTTAATTTTPVPTTTTVPTTTESNEIAPIPDYAWKVTAYSPCSASCRRGVQTEYAYCVNREGETVADNMCDQETKPEVIPRSCEGQSCEARWEVGAWSSCSVTCGGGVKFRTVSCWRMATKGIDVWIPSFNCNGTEPVATSQECGTVECVLRWQVGEWSRCSAECGEGTQTRVVLCSVTDPSKGYCDPGSRPSDTQRCEGTRCRSSWGTSPWAECRGGCQLQTRRVNCYSPAGSLQPLESQCYSQPKPLTTRICGSGTCATQWVAQSWNQDNCRDCRRAYRTRTVSCQSVSGGRTRELSDDYCSHLSVPVKKSACSCSRSSSQSSRRHPSSSDRLPTPRWYTTRWSECSESCGGGQRHRKVKCYQGRVPSSRCDTNFMPPSTQACNTEECVVCTDNPQVKCLVIRQAALCKYKYYSDNCCRTCSQGK